jgi:ring-1,2-phenylacetyl-CoA epoxidase subunit PaaD
VKTNLLTRAAHAAAVPEPRWPEPCWGESTQDRAWRVASAVSTPNLPALTLGDLGVLRDVTADDMSRVHVQLLRFTPDDPTPDDPMQDDPMQDDTVQDDTVQEKICDELVDALTMAGYLHVDVEIVSP